MALNDKTYQDRAWDVLEYINRMGGKTNFEDDDSFSKALQESFKKHPWSKEEEEFLKNKANHKEYVENLYKQVNSFMTVNTNDIKNPSVRSTVANWQGKPSPNGDIGTPGVSTRAFFKEYTSLKPNFWGTKYNFDEDKVSEGTSSLNWAVNREWSRQMDVKRDAEVKEVINKTENKQQPVKQQQPAKKQPSASEVRDQRKNHNTDQYSDKILNDITSLAGTDYKVAANTSTALDLLVKDNYQRFGVPTQMMEKFPALAMEQVKRNSIAIPNYEVRPADVFEAMIEYQSSYNSVKNGTMSPRKPGLTVAEEMYNSTREMIEEFKKQGLITEAEANLLQVKAGISYVPDKLKDKIRPEDNQTYNACKEAVLIERGLVVPKADVKEVTQIEPVVVQQEVKKEEEKVDPNAGKTEIPAKDFAYLALKNGEYDIVPKMNLEDNKALLPHLDFDNQVIINSSKYLNRDGSDKVYAEDVINNPNASNLVKFYAEWSKMGCKDFADMSQEEKDRLSKFELTKKEAKVFESMGKGLDDKGGVKLPAEFIKTKKEVRIENRIAKLEARQEKLQEKQDKIKAKRTDKTPEQVSDKTVKNDQQVDQNDKEPSDNKVGNVKDKVAKGKDKVKNVVETKDKILKEGKKFKSLIDKGNKLLNR